MYVKVFGLGERIKKAREHREISRAELAKKLGNSKITASDIERLETYDRLVSLIRLARICHALNYRFEIHLFPKEERK